MTMDWLRIRKILTMSAPTVVSMMVQGLTSLLTAGLLGRFGLDTLAGVGVAATILATLSMAMLGLDTGVQAVVARMKGEGRSDETGAVLFGALLMSIAAGLVLAIISASGGPVFLSLILHTPESVAIGSTYLRVSSPSLLFMGAIYAFSAYWNAIGRPRYPLYMNLLMVASGLAFCFVLMFGLFGSPRLGAVGAATAYVLANLVGAIGHLVIALCVARVKGFGRNGFDRATVGQMLKIGAPISAQQSMVNLGAAVWFGIIGLIGAHEVALANIYLRLENLTVVSAVGVGVGTASLVGWAMGAKDFGDSRRWGWEGAMVGCAINLPVVLVLLLAPETILRLFIQNPAIVAAGVAPLRIIAVTLLFNTAGRILGFGMRGAGATGYIASIDFLLNWFVALPLAWIAGVWLDRGLVGVAISRVVVVALEVLIICACWRSDIWTGERARWALFPWRSLTPRGREPGLAAE